MLTKITAREARDNFTDLLGSVYYGREPVAVEKKGRIFAVVVNPNEYQILKKVAKTRFFELVDDIQRVNRDKDARKVLKDVTFEVEQVRKTRYAESG